MQTCSLLLIALSIFLFSSSFEGRTTLELAISRAFNERVKDQSWVDIFGTAEDIHNQDFCPGSTSLWPWPTVAKDSDLEAALDRGYLKCAFNGNAVYYSTDYQVLLDTRTSPPTGLIVDFYNKIGEAVAEHYQTPFSVVWNTSSTVSDVILQSVTEGYNDAACGRYTLGGVYKGTTARGDLFSELYCPTYLESPQVWTRAGSGVTTWAALVDKIDNNGWVMCTVGSANGGTAQVCSSVLDEYSTTEASCIGVGSNAFVYLLGLSTDGSCDAVYSSAPPPDFRSSFSGFPSPVISALGAFFRTKDMTATFAAKTVLNLNIKAPGSK